jgi:lipopolysaccharide assembly protein A
MRLVRFFVAFACLVLGAIVGALNRTLISIDFGIGSVATNLGVALIVALLLGVLIGGLAISASLVLPLRRRLVRAERQRIEPTSKAGS